MRIISGTKRGTKLFTLEGVNTRPTLDRVKEALFNIIHFMLQEEKVLDLFAGSGALGLEAISRGAKQVVFCDNNKDAIQIIQKNIAKTKTEKQAIVMHMPYEKALETLKQKQEMFHVIFLDPPYASDFAQKATEKIIEFGLLDKDGIMIIETDHQEKLLETINQEKIEIYDIRTYGRVNLLFLKRKE